MNELSVRVRPTGEISAFMLLGAALGTQDRSRQSRVRRAEYYIIIK